MPLFMNVGYQLMTILSSQETAANSSDESAQGGLECPMCPFKTRHVVKYNSHVRDHIQPPIIECPFCPYKVEYVKKDQFRTHLFDHLDEDLVCTVCGYTTKQLQLLRLHYYTHKRNYHCDLCEYKTGYADCMRDHKIIHNAKITNKVIPKTTDKVCPICAEPQYELKQYHKHLESHECPMKCRFCSTYEANILRNLRRHVLRRHKFIM